MIRLSAIFLLLSGIASLTYQVVWVRLLGISMGSTSASISTVLAAFFFGLAIGSYFAERLTKNNISSLHPYLILEAIIAISGLILLPILLNLDSFIAAVPSINATISMKFIITMTLLSIPTICMGATFPVMAALIIRKQTNFGLRMSQLYSLNTAGAVLGAALSGFLFIPLWGLDGAIYLAVGINVFIVCSGLYLNKHIKLSPIENPNTQSKQDLSAPRIAFNTAAPLRSQALFILFLTGFVSIACEVAWTKYLSIFTGTTIYGFAAILTIFLIGISSGSWAIKNHIAKIKKPELWISSLVILLGASLIITRVILNWVPNYYEFINQLNTSQAIIQTLKYALVFAILFIPTFIFGALFPINLKLYCGNFSGVRTRIGKAYAVNTLASIFGAVAAGFYIIPKFGTDQLLTAMAILMLIAPIIFMPSIKQLSRKIALGSTALVIIISSTWLPHIDYKSLITSIDYNAKFGGANNAFKNPKYLFLKEGKTGVISMVTYNGRTVYLQNNGLKESVYDLKNEYNVLLTESLLGLVPYFLHPNPKNAFIVGFGGGVTTKALSFTKLLKIKVVELEPAVVEAGRAVLKHEIPVLADPRVSLEFNDARNTLLMSPQKYDIIASQPSHPWLAHAATVFTQEFFQLVNSRLTPKGIYGQWVNLFQMDTTTLKSLFKSFYNVFPEGMIFANLYTGDLIMYGSNYKLNFDFAQIEKRMQETKIKKAMQHHKIMSANDLLYYFALSRKQAVALSHDAIANTDLNILSEVRLSHLAKKLPLKENPYVFLRQNYQFNISSYFSKNLAQNLNRIGLHFLAYNEYKMTNLIADQLMKSSPSLSRALRYRILWRQARFKNVISLYKQYKQWPGEIHIQQALLLTRNGKLEQAKTLLMKIDNEISRIELTAKILIEERKYKYTKVKIFSDSNIKNLTGYTKKDLITIGMKLNDIATSSLSGLPKLIFLEKHLNAKQIVMKNSHYLFSHLRKKEHLKLKLNMDSAIATSKLVLAKRILTHMNKHNALSSQRLQEYKKQIDQLTTLKTRNKL